MPMTLRLCRSSARRSWKRLALAIGFAILLARLLSTTAKAAPTQPAAAKGTTTKTTTAKGSTASDTLKVVCSETTDKSETAVCVILTLDKQGNLDSSVNANLEVTFQPNLTKSPLQKPASLSGGQAVIPIPFDGVDRTVKTETLIVTASTSPKLEGSSQAIQLNAPTPAAATPGAAAPKATLYLYCPSTMAVGEESQCVLVALDPKQNYLIDSDEVLTVAETDNKSVWTSSSQKLNQGEFLLKLSFPGWAVGDKAEVKMSYADNTSLVNADISITAAAAIYNGGEIRRLVGGVAGAFAPNTQPAGKLFADFYLEVPIYTRFHYWLQAGLRSTTQAATSANVSALASAATGGTSSLTGLSFQSVESFALRSGISVRIGKSGAELAGIPHGTSSTEIQFIAGGGFTTPTTTPTPPPAQVFCARPGTSDSTPTCAPLTGSTGPPTPPPAGDLYYVENPPIRTSFFGNWEAGFRFETFYNNHTDSLQPAVTDITIGQDQQVTAGTLQRPVFHFEGFWPVPNADFIFLIFGGSVRLPGNNIGYQPVPVNLTPISITNYTGPLTGPNFAQHYGPVFAADNFRVGVAVDIVDLFKNHLSLSQKNQSGQ